LFKGDTITHITDDFFSGNFTVPVDEESEAAVASMQQTIEALTAWRDNTCFDVLKPRQVESCTCPVCVAIRSLELAIEHIYRIFE